MESMTDEVAHLVLANNYSQNSALMVGTHLAPKLFSVHRRLMSELEKAGRLNREIEFLPSDEECGEREATGEGLTQPELSVLLAYVKITLKEAILASDLPDDPWCDAALTAYFPTPLRGEYEPYTHTHPLRREIIATVLVNEVVDAAGITFVHRAIEETGASAVDVVRAFVVVREVFALPRLWSETVALDNIVATDAQITVAARLRRIIDRGVRWMLQSRGGTLDITAEIARFGESVTALLPLIPELVVEQETEALRLATRELTDAGIPVPLAEQTIASLHGFGLLNIVDLAIRRGAAPVEVARVYYTVSARFRMDELFERITDLPRHDRWTALARMALRYDLYAVLAGVTGEVVEQAGGATGPAAKLVEDWAAANRVRIERVETTLAMLSADAPSDLATLSVLLRQMRSMTGA
jgi:glutamate dehydrogenase